MKQTRLCFALLMACLMLPACGFHIRGELPGTQKEKTVFITGLSKSNPLYINLAQDVASGGGIMASKPADASAVINVVRAIHLRRPITLSAAGRANMFDLTFRVVYDVHNPKGDVLIPEQELDVRREYFNTQGSPLGQGYEEVQMREEMEKEAARTLLRQVVFNLRGRSGKS